MKTLLAVYSLEEITRVLSAALTYTLAMIESKTFHLERNMALRKVEQNKYSKLLE